MKIVLLLGIIIFFILLCSYKKENFAYCTNCDNKLHDECIDCTNCGICIDYNGQKRCESGDANGPFNRNDCAYWIHGWKDQAMMR
jgi:hypothetical protein